MGFFGSIKKNLNHGGVKISISAPASTSMSDASLPVTVNITAADSPASIKRVRVEVIAESQNKAFSQPGNANSTPQTTFQVLAQADNLEPFTLEPGQSKEVPLSIVMNSGAALAAQLPEGSAGAAIGNALGQLQKLGEAMNQNSYSYKLQASVDVDGIAIDPSARQPLQILKPGQMGGAFNLKI